MQLGALVGIALGDALVTVAATTITIAHKGLCETVAASYYYRCCGGHGNSRGCRQHVVMVN